jgi:SanA protein
MSQPEPQAPPGRSPRGGGRSRLAAAAGFGLALVVATNAYVVATTRARIVPAVVAAPARPVAIVLGNKVFPDGRPSRSLAERLRTALLLYRAGRVARIVVSGASHGDYDEPGGMAHWLISRGVPARDVVLDRGGHRTAATMADVAAMGVRSALVCTHGYHLPRALYLARHAGIDAVGVPAVDAEGENDERWKGPVTFVREALARTETVFEVAVRGVGP